MTVRSACVARGVVAAGAQSNVYTVPAGYTFIFKSCAFWTSGAGAATTSFALGNPNTTLIIYLYNQVLSASVPNVLQTYAVLNPGDHLLIGSINAGTGYWISGSLLAGVAPNIPAAVELGEPFDKPATPGPPEPAPQRISIT